MRGLFLVVLLFSVSTALSQYRFRFEFEDVCGSPLSESQIYKTRWGTVIEIKDGDTVRIKDTGRKTWIVDLAGVDAGRSNQDAKEFLIGLILGKEVRFVGNPRKEQSKRVEAIVHVSDIEVNRRLIEKGLASYRDTDYGYAVSSYTLCVYHKLQQAARSQKLGIWAAN